MPFVPGQPIDYSTWGAGDELHLVLAERGYQIEPGCGCLATIDLMNRGGILWSRQNIKMIEDQLFSEAKRRGVRFAGIDPPTVFIRLMARSYILLALRRYDRKRRALGPHIDPGANP